MDATHDDDDGPGFLDAEALLARAMGLMTAHAETRCDGERRRLARKIADDVARLAEEPGISAHFRLVLYTMRAHWQHLEYQYSELPPRPDSIYTRGVSNAIH